MRAWVATGTIYEKVAEKGLFFSIKPDDRQDIPHADAEDVVQETIIEAIEHFRDDVLIPGVWDPAKGASLRTFFIGQTLIRFQNVIRRWQNYWRNHRKVILTDTREYLAETASVRADEHPEKALLIRVEVAEVLASMPDREAFKDAPAIFALRAEGWKIAEIADSLDLSVSKVNMTMKRVRDYRKAAHEETLAREEEERGASEDN